MGSYILPGAECKCQAFRIPTMLAPALFASFALPLIAIGAMAVAAGVPVLTHRFAVVGFPSGP